MLDLDFFVDGAMAVPYAAAPQISLQTRIVQKPTSQGALSQIHTITLRCQVMIQPGLRRYLPAEQAKLVDLYGQPQRWGQTVRAAPWTNTSVIVPAFERETRIDLPLPCTFDFNIATTKYFHALEAGEIPLSLLFSGTVFYAAEDGALQVAQIPWEKEAAFRLPMKIWKEMMEIYYPNSAWLCLRHDIFDRLSHFKSHRGLTTWEQAIELLLEETGAEVEGRVTESNDSFPPSILRGRVRVGVLDEAQPPPQPSPGVPGAGDKRPPAL